MPLTVETTTEQLQFADLMLAGRDHMFEPQDLPRRYGRVVAALDQVMAACTCESVVGDGWAVWRHGYLGRVTQDIDIALPADRVEDFLKTAAVSGFDLLTSPSGSWPKLRHRDTGIEVDVLPEGGRPGTAAHPAPTTIPPPHEMGAERGRLKYMTLASLVELNLAAGRLRDEADIVELIRENADQVSTIQTHLLAVHQQYADRSLNILNRAKNRTRVDYHSLTNRTA